MLHRTPAYATRILTLPIAARFRTKASLLFCMAAAALSILVSTSAPTDAQVRFEMRPVETPTLSAQQFLTGDKNVKSAIVAGELRIPQPGTDKLPAVILVHGAGGVSSLHERWVQELNSAGVATFLLDSSGRGLVSLVNDESQLDLLAGMIERLSSLGDFG